jgi:anthranilate phosphoribosyltransferase
MSDVVRAALAAVVEGQTLSFQEARAAMGAVMDGAATPAQLAALLVALRMRGETVDELAGFAAAMRERVLAVEAPPGAIDVVGTGGDGSRTFNISTAAALVVAAAGVPVAKHGNRAITSLAGSADALDALGVRIDHDPASAAAALRNLGFAFLFAPTFHPAMRHAGPTRKEIGVRTAFNLLGPLTNPAGVRRLMVGTADPAAAPKLADVLRLLGDERAFVVHGAGIDELPLDGTGVLYDVTPAGVTRRTVDPQALGLPRRSTAELRGGSPEENARRIEAIFAGEAGPQRDVVLLNAGAALVVAGRASDLAEGIALAAATIDEGRAAAFLERLRRGREDHASSSATAGGGAVSAVASAPVPRSGGAGG